MSRPIQGTTVDKSSWVPGSTPASLNQAQSHQYGQPPNANHNFDRGASLESQQPFKASRGAGYGADGSVHDENRIEGGPTGGIGARYVLMALHFILLSLITILHTIYIGDIVIFAIHLAMCLAFLIYIPAAFGISLSRKKSRFDRAGGEVAYLVVQQLGWLVCIILSAIVLRVTTCNTVTRVPTTGGRVITIRLSNTRCAWLSAMLGLTVVQFLLLMGWMIWIIVVVRRRSPGNSKRVFGISTAWLLRGWRAWGERGDV